MEFRDNLLAKKNDLTCQQIATPAKKRDRNDDNNPTPSSA
jgi:hypothetical protein